MFYMWWQDFSPPGFPHLLFFSKTKRFVIPVFSFINLPKGISEDLWALFNNDYYSWWLLFSHWWIQKLQRIVAEHAQEDLRVLNRPNTIIADCTDMTFLGRCAPGHIWGFCNSIINPELWVSPKSPVDIKITGMCSKTTGPKNSRLLSSVTLNVCLYSFGLFAFPLPHTSALSGENYFFYNSSILKICFVAMVIERHHLLSLIHFSSH